MGPILRRTAFALALAFSLTLVALACKTPDPGTACVPGRQIGCTCPGGTASVQVCSDDGDRFESCQCAPFDGAPPPTDDSGADTSISDAGRDGARDGGPTTSCVLAPAPDGGAGGGALLGMARYGLTSFSSPYDVAIEPGSGNIAVVGSFSGTMDFGGGVLDAGTDFEAGGGAFVASFDANGRHRWSKSFGSGGATAHDLAFDNTGDAIVSVYLRPGATADLGCGTVSAGAVNAMLSLAKLDTNGACVWNKTFDWAGVAGIATDKLGNVLLGGLVSEVGVDFGGGRIQSAFYVAKLDRSGTFQWNVASPGERCTSANPSFTVDSSGNALLSGCFQGSVDFGAGKLTSSTLGDAFIAKYAPSGALVWGKAFKPTVLTGNTSSNIGGRTLAVDPCGSIFIAGSFNGQTSPATLDFGGTATPLLERDGHTFFAKLDADGNGLWAKSLKASSAISPLRTAADGAGNVFLAALLEGYIDFGGGRVDGRSGSTGSGGLSVLASFDSRGAFRWHASPGAPPATVASLVPAGIAASGNQFVSLNAFRGSCSRITCQTSPAGSNTLMLQGQSLTAVAAGDTMLMRLTP